MTVAARRRQVRAQSIGMGGWGGWIGDPAAIPPASAYNTATAGVVVNERTVLSLMAVSSCLRVVGDTGSGLQPHVHRMTGSQRRHSDPEVDPPEVIEDPYADIDREDGDFRCTASLGLNGNMYKHIVDRDRNGNPLQVEVLNPSMVKVSMEKGAKVYKIGAAGIVIPSADIVQVPWLSLAGGLVGLNPIEMGVSGFGGGLAAQEYAGRYFSQGASPTGILSVDKPLRPEDAEKLSNRLMTQHGGLAQSHVPIVLDASAKWQQISITPETAQLLQTRQFSRGEIAGFYGVPGQFIGDIGNEGGPYGKGLQEMLIGFVLIGLAGYTKRLDRADTRLLPAGYYVKRKTDDLFKTNSQMLAALLSALRMNAIATPNEAREIAGLPRHDEPGSDSLFAPINSAHADFLAHGGVGPETGLPDGLPPRPGTGGPGEPAAVPVSSASAELDVERLIAEVRAVVERVSAERDQRPEREPVFNLYMPAQPAQPAPIVNVAAPNVTVQPPEVRVEAPIVNVAPPTVNVAPPEVRVAAPVVNVAPPTVNVAAPEVRVEAPNVTVQAPKPSSKRVERDTLGNIRRIVEEPEE